MFDDALVWAYWRRGRTDPYYHSEDPGKWELHQVSCTKNSNIFTGCCQSLHFQAALKQMTENKWARKQMAGKIYIKYLLCLSLALSSLFKMLTMFLRQKEDRNGKSKWIDCGYGLFSFPNRGVLCNRIFVQV